MKDEELAKEYEEKAEYIEVDDYGKKRYDSIDIQQAFLAGLKAGRPQWHKSSEKLPEKCTTVLNEDGDKVYYDYNIKCWRYDDEDLNISLPPIAWCEIPTFDKE